MLGGYTSRTLAGPSGGELILRERDTPGIEEGRLYVVSTPIGNLGDITFRALEVLKGVDLVVAEDTRRTGRLLAHYQVQNRITSYHDYNKEKKTPVLIKKLLSGRSIALVSDAGTPGISDPCYFLVKRAIDNGIPVVPIPGASAFLSALVVSGLPTDRFLFEGFLPHKGSQRRKRLLELREEKRTLIFYESPHRIVEMLSDALEILGDRETSISRELTKKFEETVKGRLSELVAKFQLKRPKGEFVVIVSGNQEE